MKKSLSILVILIASFNPTFAQRKVLIEQFTNSGCPPCAIQTPIIANYVNSNSNNSIMLAYHTVFPYLDSLYYENAQQSDQRLAFYNIGSVPSSVVDGNVYKGASSGLTPNLGTTITNRAAVLPRYSITFSNSILNGNQISATLLFTSTNSNNAADVLKARIVVVEKRVLKSAYLAPPGYNSETEYPYVVRRMLPDANGVTLVNKAFGGTDTVTVNLTLNNVKDLNQVRVIAFVQNATTKEIYQTELSIPSRILPPAVTSACTNTQFKIGFTANGTYQSGNVFTALLSDVNGNFTNSINIGTFTGTSSDSINTTIPLGTLAGSTYRIKIVSSNPLVTENASTLFTVKGSPVASFSPANPSICPGSSVAISTTVITNSYTWSPSTGLDATTGASVIANPVITTNYTITATAKNLCVSNYTNTVSVLCPAPVANNTTSITTNKATANWTAVNCANVYRIKYRVKFATTWLTVSNIASTSYLINNLKPGTAYQWKVATKCPDGKYSLYSAVKNFTTPILKTVAENLINKNQLISKLYPNPAAQFVTLELECIEDGDATINIMNTLGTTVFEKNIVIEDGVNSTQLDLQNLAKGVYSLSIKKQDSFQVLKLIKN